MNFWKHLREEEPTIEDDLLDLRLKLESLEQGSLHGDPWDLAYYTEKAEQLRSRVEKLEQSIC